MSSPSRRPMPRRDPPAGAATGSTGSSATGTGSTGSTARRGERAQRRAAARSAVSGEGVTPTFAAAVRARAREKATARERESRPAVLRPSSQTWYGALMLMFVALAVLWAVEVVNAYDDYGLDRFGLRPREASGLWGVLTMPLLHQNAEHMLSNTFPFLLIGWVVMLAGLRVWTVVTFTIVVLGGLLTWLVAPSDTVIVGASALVFGWLGYLLARAFFSRRIRWVLTAFAVLFFFGTLLFGLFPTLHSDVSWQAHVCGFVAGVAVGFALHPRGGTTRTFRRAAVS